MAMNRPLVVVFVALFTLNGVACSHSATSPRPGGTHANATAGSDKPVRDPSEQPFRPSFADCADDSEGVTSTLQACMDVEYQYQNERLRSAYLSLLHSLDEKSRRIAERQQAEWLAEKDEKCAWDAVRGGQAQRLEANYCNVQYTALRAIELEKTVASRQISQ